MASLTAQLTDRAIVRLAGEDWKPFLQGLITNDVNKINENSWTYAALLTPQGKYLYDFFLSLDGEDLVIDVFGGHRDTLVRKLMMYRLRTKVDITPTDEAIYASWGGDYDTHVDPRHPDMGARTLTGEIGATIEQYKAHRLGVGIPDGPHDLLQDKTLWLESNADLLGGVDFEKGCYVGQELTARMKYRGKVRRRIIPIEADSDIPANTPILLGEREIGDTRSALGTLGLANLKVEDLEKGPLMAGDTQIKPRIPSWLKPTVESAKEPA